MESRQEAYLSLKVEMIIAIPLLLTQLREYRTALEARPAMPEREAIAQEVLTVERYNELFDPADEAGNDTFSNGFREGFLYAKFPEGYDQSDVDEAMREIEDIAIGEAWQAYRDEFFRRLPIAAIPDQSEIGNPLPTTGDVREAAPEREDYRHALLELLAVIHRDGGQKTQEVGWKLSTEHAMRISAERIASLASPPSAHDMRKALEVIAKLDKRARDYRYTDQIDEPWMVLTKSEFLALRAAALASSPMDAVKAAAEDEREACAKVADAEAAKRDAESYGGNLFATGGLVASKCIAQAIRARAGGAE